MGNAGSLACVLDIKLTSLLADSIIIEVLKRNE